MHHLLHSFDFHILPRYHCAFYSVLAKPLAHDYKIFPSSFGIVIYHYFLFRTPPAPASTFIGSNSRESRQAAESFFMLAFTRISAFLSLGHISQHPRQPLHAKRGLVSPPARCTCPHCYATLSWVLWSRWYGAGRCGDGG